MKLIKLLEIKDFGTYKKRIALYECPICNKKSEHRKEQIDYYKPSMCKGCSTRKHSTTHGQRHTKLYKKWQEMKSRVYNKNTNSYKSYGGRGIAICQEWRDDFMVFKEWADTNAYADNLSIERINNNGNYEPSNCKWIPFAEQQRNTRRTLKNRFSDDVLTDAIEYYTNTNATREGVAAILGISKNTFRRLLVDCS